MSEQLDPITNLPEKGNTGLPESFKIKNNRTYSPSVTLTDTRTYSQNDDYLSGVDPNVSGDREKQQISDNQSTMEALGNTTGRLLGNIVPEVIRGFAYLEDVVTGNPNGNAITEAMTSWIDNVNQELPLYSSPNNKIINWENMSGLVNSMASFAVTGMGVGSVLSKLGTFGKVGGAIGQLGTATALTGIEGAMEANELLKNSYTQEFNKLYLENIQKGQDPALAQQNADVLAKRNVESAAKTAMMTNYINVALNLTSAGYFIKGGNPLDDIGRAIKNPAKFMSKDTLGNLAKESAQEALEEGVNVFAGAAGKNKLKGGNYTFNDIWSNVDGDELKASMILGAIGGIGQTAISTGITNIDTKWYKGKNVGLRETYAKQQDFLNNVKRIYNNPNDYSQPLLDITQSAAMLQQAKELEEAGNSAEAQKIRSLVVAYQAHQSFENGTWKDLRDVYQGLQQNDQLSTEQKENAKKAVQYMNEYEKIYKNTSRIINEKNPNRFSLYANRVENFHLNEELKPLREELMDYKNRQSQMLRDIDSDVNLNEKEKETKKKEVENTFKPTITQIAKEISDVQFSQRELENKFHNMIDENMDDLNIEGKVKSILTKQRTAQRDLIYKAKDKESLDKALSRFDDQPEVRDNHLKDAAERQQTKANIDYTDENSITSSLSERWTNKPALERVERESIAKVLNIDPTSSIVDIANVIKENEESTKKYFEVKDEAVDTKIINDLNEILKELEVETVSAETGDPTIPTIENPSYESAEYDSVTISHEKGHPSYNPLFQEGIDMMNNSSLMGATVYFETTKEEIEGINQNFEKSKTKRTNENFTVYVVYYKDGNSNNKSKDNRVVVSKLRANSWVDKKTNKNVQLSEPLMRVREEILKGYDNSEVYTLPLSTRVKTILIGKIQTKAEFTNPINSLKSGEKLTLAIAVNKDGIIDLDSNWKDIGIDPADVLYNKTKLKNGGVYMLVKLPNGKYVANLLKVERNNTLSQEHQDKIKNLVYAFLDENSNPKELREQLNELVHTKFRYDPNTKTFLTPRVLKGTKIIRSKDVYSLSADQLVETLLNDIVQVSVKRINKGEYNNNLANSGAIKSNISHNRFSGNNIQLEYPKWGTTVAAKTTASVESTSPSNIDNQDQTDDNSMLDLGDDSDFGFGSTEEVSTIETAPIPDIEIKKEEPVNTTERVEKVDGNLKSLPSSKKKFGKKSIKESSNVKWNSKRELNRLSKILPGTIADKTKVVEEIERIGSLTTYGIFENGIITIIKDAIPGTAYHEAVHAVVELLLTHEQKVNLLNELGKEYSPSAERLSFLSNLYPNLNNREIYELALEEELADRFAEFAINRDAVRKVGKEQRNLWERILYWFNNIFNIVSNKKQVDRFFNNLYDGKFSKAKLLVGHQNFSKRSIEKDPAQKYARLENLKVFWADIMNELTSLEENKGMKDIEIINGYGFENIMNAIITKIVMDRNAAIDQEIDEDYTEDFKNNVINRFNYFLNNLTDLSKITVEESDVFGELNFLEGNSFLAKSELSGESPLLLSFTEHLNNLGIRVKITKKNNVVLSNKHDAENVSDDNNTDESLENNETSRENWQFKAHEESSEKSFSTELKRILSSIQKDKTDELGYSVFENYTEVRNFLLENIADTYDPDLMMSKLNDFRQFKPFVETMYQKALNDESFKSDLFIYIAAKHDANFTKLIRDEQNNILAIKANRNNISMVIQEDMKNKFKNSKVLRGNDIINSVAKEMYAAKEALVSKLQKDSSYTFSYYDDENYMAILNDNVLDEVYAFMNEYSFDVNRNQLRELANKGRTEILGFVRDEIGKVVDYLQPKTNSKGEVVPGKNVLSLSDEGVKEGTLLGNIAKRLIPVSKHKSEKSMLNTEGKKIFTHGNSNFLKEFISRIKNDKKATLEMYANDPFFKNSFFINDILSDEFDINKLEITVLDGSALFEYKDLVFDKMERVDQDIMTIAAFFNQNRDNALYRLPVLSDAPQTGFVTYKKIKSASQSSEFWDKVYSVALQEYTRMQFVKENEEFFKGVKNVLNRNESYLLSPYLNKNGKADKSIKVDSTEGKAEVIALAKQYYEAQFAKELERLEALGIYSFIERNGVSGITTLLSTDMYWNNKVSNYDPEMFIENLSDYFYNTTLFNSQMISVFSGDPVYYKSNDDWQKRNKQIWSPSIHLDTSKINPSYITLTAKDEMVNSLGTKDSPSEFKMFLEEVFEDHPLKEDIIEKYSDNNLTDAQSFITINRYKEIMVGLNRWTKKHEKIYQKIKSGKTIKSGDSNFIYSDYFSLFSAIKPFDFHHRSKMVTNGKELNIIHPYQSKRAEMLLIPQNVSGKPKLERLLATMEEIEKQTGLTVAFNYDSAIKDGNHNVYNSIDEIPSVDDMKKGSIVNTVELSNSRYGLQVEVPEHYLDDENNFGSQIMKLIQSDIDDDVIFTANEIPNIEKLIGKSEATFAEIRDLYQRLIATNIEHDFNKLKGSMKNKISLKRTLYKSAMQNQLPESYFETLGNLNDDHFPMPLWFPGWGKKNEQVLHSLLRNKVVKQKFPGASLVNVSSVGKSDDLKIVFDKDRKSIKHFEARLPYWTKEFYKEFVEDDGTINPEKIIQSYLNKGLSKEEAQNKYDEVFSVVAYRIPTEHKHSMFKIKVVGFTHPLNGGAIELPAEATTISGFDFDIDKLYCMFPSLNKESLKNGMLEKLQYNSDNLFDVDKSNEERQNAILDIVSGILSTPQAAKQTLEPSSFDDIKVNAYRIYLLEKGKDSFNMSDKEVTDLIKNESLDLCLPSTQAEYIERNRVGKALIGFFANHNTCHAFAQTTSLRAPKAAKFNKVQLSELNTKFNVKGRLISKVLAGFLAAATDNAKDPIASFMNLNIFTVDTYAYLIRLGYDPKTIQLFMSQKIIKDLEVQTKKNFNDVEQALYELKSGLIDEIKAHPILGEKYIKGSVYNFNDNELITHLKQTSSYEEALNQLTLNLNNNDLSIDVKNNIKENFLNEWVDYIIRNDRIITTFSKYMAFGDSLGNLSTAIKVDKVSSRSTLSDLEVIKNKFLEIIPSTPKPNQLLGVEDFLENVILGAYYDNGVESAQDLFSEYFPWLSNGFRSVKQIIREVKGNNLTSSELENINYMLLTYFAKDHEFFNNKNKNALVKDLPKLIDNYLDTHKDEDSIYNIFLSKFAQREREMKLKMKTNKEIEESRFEDDEFGGGEYTPKVTILEFYRQGLNGIERQQLTSIWERMLQEPKDSDEYLIARNLIRYAFLRSGFTVTSTSYMDIVPPSFYMELKDSTGKSFIQYMEDKLTEFNRGTSNEHTEFLDLFYGNNYHMNKLLKNVPKTSDVTVSIGDDNKTRGIVVSGKSLKKLLTSSPKEAIFAEYITYDGNVYKLNPNPVSDNAMEYMLLSKRGLKNFFIEMDSNASLGILEDINKQYNFKPIEVSEQYSVSFTEDEEIEPMFDDFDDFGTQDENSIMNEIFDDNSNTTSSDVNEQISESNIEVLDWFIENIDNLTEEQQTMLGMEDIFTKDDIRKIDPNNTSLIGILLNIKCR